MSKQAWGEVIFLKVDFSSYLGFSHTHTKWNSMAVFNLIYTGDTHDRKCAHTGVAPRGLTKFPPYYLTIKQAFQNASE